MLPRLKRRLRDAAKTKGKAAKTKATAAEIETHTQHTPETDDAGIVTLFAERRGGREPASNQHVVGARSPPEPDSAASAMVSSEACPRRAAR